MEENIDPGCTARGYRLQLVDNLTVSVALGAAEEVVSSSSLEVFKQGLGVWLDDLEASV